ncbi:MAG TPA: 4-hydroxy-tetrahydrodipicolinate reductase [Clostridia bacterium]|nr:4-hydroxy-tetrahydrodipicolinate reductase [Clostridia bacterium]
MNRIILSGCNGKMGGVVSKTITENRDCVIVAGIDVKSGQQEDYPVFSDPSGFQGKADVIIDFSNPGMLDCLLTFAKSRKIPIVIATTGFSRAQIQEIEAAAKEIPVFFSANMSLGVNLMIEIAKKAAAVLSPNFDIEIIEMHHNQKVDAPSGTALMIADGISSVLDKEPQYVYDRHSQRKKREKTEIGIHAIRGGTVVGEHEVIFAGQDEMITIRHSAMSKQVFAAGALKAAIFLMERKPGLYQMEHLVNTIGG